MKSSKILFIILTLAFFSCSQNTTKEDTTEIQEENVSTAIIYVDELLNNPDDFVGQKIQLTGLVTHVCKHSGKRLHLTSAESNNMIRVEAAEGINQFQRELEGSNIVVEGVMQKEVINEDYIAKWENERKGEGHESHEEANHEETEEQVLNMKKRLADSGKDELVTYWVDGNSFKAE